MSYRRIPKNTMSGEFTPCTKNVNYYDVTKGIYDPKIIPSLVASSVNPQKSLVRPNFIYIYRLF